ncbi:protein of unknown function [Taphrina deformans PYCC 5710]|uniref:Uncharacterized protein n=1 Tax=Taphrina deformans (strain PYCC 5710 / ATCC 11124 / CBS 356.35 / IMI 108563 / JCM 9778 / NBRC 8474) TaxID=1097556 RepID=R4XAC0_TAPDE|nr:protein of unknown function [Taphrina deformans PYCC 5710]|eukprot:CCG81219.1 protein of unknown function [Taphrina deformans PYCC 5710]
MFCLASGLLDLFRRRFIHSVANDIQGAISSYIFNGAARQQALEELVGFARGPDAKVLVDLLRRQLEPRWSDANHAIRERLTVQILTCIPDRPFLILCAQNYKLVDLLDYHLRACTFINIVGAQQLFLARRIQNWLNLIVTNNPDSSADLSQFFDMQSKYLRSWQAHDECERSAALLRSTRASPTNAQEDTTASHRAQPLRSKTTGIPLPELHAIMSDADILCFDILKMLMHPDENGPLIQSATIQATKTKLYLARFSELPVQFQESQSQSARKGKVVDTVQRLEYCIGLVAACDVVEQQKKSLSRSVEKVELLPPVYQYRIP